ncbi:glycosyl hydrolase family 8 [Falsiroseomonas selenitidurans]|uniref:cellulase n=1 Tax=Falsiroseomonas selenitidurans TaxID=2716335 RepID=A0ABX1E591_9PROT|nr:glycosyl hydrolase family 8 [Falsiroseomonas selenitidurans]NKC32163.1 glycosyl hydrolase family 5 [Falsiroseomonas selenitidurans]
MVRQPYPQAGLGGGLGRRALFGAGIAAGAALAGAPAMGAAVLGDWLDFRHRFLHPDGRVLDTGNGGISHSEGQGAALLFAVRFDDRPSFERILAWTRGALRRPDDQLLAWAFRPGAPIPVPDVNNASDGDLMVAWALAEAGDRWGLAEKRALAAEIARDLLRRCVMRQGEATLLLPGVEGFLKPDRLVVNPSYFITPAFRALARLVPDPAWMALEEGGLALLEQARFGRWRLPADWLALSRGLGRPQPAPGWPARFSYDAVRVPLNLAWGGHARSGALRAAVEFWADPTHAAPPAWTDLRSNAVAPYPGDSGLRAVASLGLAALAGRGRVEALPRVAEASAYYPAVLTLQARLAWADRGLDGNAACSEGPLAIELPPAAPPAPREGGNRGWLRGIWPVRG